MTNSILTTMKTLFSININMIFSESIDLFTANTVANNVNKQFNTNRNKNTITVNIPPPTSSTSCKVIGFILD